MGAYFRRSWTRGLVRLSFSTGGVNVSVGVKGARIGCGPRGTYAHLGRGGFGMRVPLRSRVVVALAGVAVVLVVLAGLARIVHGQPASDEHVQPVRFELRAASCTFSGLSLAPL